MSKSNTAVKYPFLRRAQLTRDKSNVRYRDICLKYTTVVRRKTTAVGPANRSL